MDKNSNDPSGDDEEEGSNYANKENVYSIDIGSSYSKFTTRRGPAAAELLQNSGGQRHVPSFLLKDINTDNSVVGQLAYQSRFSKSRDVLSHSHFLKLILKEGSGADFTQNGYVAFQTSMYNELLGMAKAKFPSNDKSVSVASVPNFFTASHQQEIEKTLNGIGFSCFASVPDGISALLGAIHTNQIPDAADGHYLVIDWGGNLLQVSIVEYSRTTGKSKIIAHSSELHDGGGDLATDLLVKDLSDQFRKEVGVDVSTDSLSLQRLYEASDAAVARMPSLHILCEKSIKKSLSEAKMDFNFKNIIRCKEPEDMIAIGASYYEK